MTYDFPVDYPISPCPRFQFNVPAGLTWMQARLAWPIVDFEPGTGVVHQTLSVQSRERFAKWASVEAFGESALAAGWQPSR
jgi:hypothetical protein